MHFTWQGKLICALTRRKRSGKEENEVNEEKEEKLARVLGLIDLTALGVGATLGLGVYVLAGSVAFTDAGPAVIISFFIAAIASLFSGLCYAEFASRVPEAGSAYIYSYVTVGEFTAFFIGWNLILEYAIGTAGVAKGLSNYVNAMGNNVIKNTMMDIMPLHVPYLASYPDLFAFTIVILMSLLLSWGVKESSTVNKVFTGVNLLTVSAVIVAGAFKAKTKNWAIPKEEIPYNVKGGEGGFMPFGWAGVMAGAAKCFFGFIGYDVIATTGEEAYNPKRYIPLAIIFSLSIIFIAYIGVASVLTLMLPYYQQNAEAPLPHVFQEVGLPVLNVLIAIGAVSALCTSLLGSIFPLPRILYAMANDGLLFHPFSKIHPKSKTPVLATLLSGLLSAVMAGLFNLEQLIDMMSIGTLLAYTIVATCILILRYNNRDGSKTALQMKDNSLPPNHLNVVRNGNEFASRSINTLKLLFNLNAVKSPNNKTTPIAHRSIFFFTTSSSVLCFLVIHGYEMFNVVWNQIFILTCSIACLLSTYLMVRQPQDMTQLSFQVPVVPIIPCMSIIMNVFLMFKLDIYTWIRFIIWLILGMVIYLSYSIKHSVEGIKQNTRIIHN